MTVQNVAELCRTGQPVQYKEKKEKLKKNGISNRKNLDLQSISLACSQQAISSNKQKDSWEHKQGH